MISPQHLIAYLQGNATIVAAVGSFTLGRHTGVPVLPEISTAIAGLMPRRVVVITSSGGPEIVGVNHDMARARMDVRCYGKDVADCWALNDVVYNELRYAWPRQMNGTKVLSFFPSGGGNQDYDPDGDWPFVFTEYTMVISEGR